MGRGLALGLVGLFAFAGGCASPARYVERQSDSGIIAIPSNTNAWPAYNRREAMELIQKHVGPNYEIVEEREVVTGQSTVNNQNTNVEPTSGRGPNLPGARQTSTSTTTSQDITEWRIWYRRTAAPYQNAQPHGTPGVTPAGGLPPGTMPSVLPAGGASNVGNPPQRWISGAGSHTMPGGLRSAFGDPNCNT